jgi:SOS response regulatory protein OraA/RecX
MDGDEAAFEAAVKLLARRALSEAQVREKLLRAGHPDDEVEGAVVRLLRAGYLDDERLALDTVLLHARRGHGPGRVDPVLRALGVSDSAIARAWDEAGADHGVDPRRILRDQLRRRLPEPPAPCDESTIRRVYNALLRAGFDEAELHSELDPYVRDPTGDAEGDLSDQ